MYGSRNDSAKAFDELGLEFPFAEASEDADELEQGLAPDWFSETPFAEADEAFDEAAPTDEDEAWLDGEAEADELEHGFERSAADEWARPAGELDKEEHMAWLDLEAGLEANDEFAGLANAFDETELMLDESAPDADFETPQAGSASFALLRAIPDRADFARFVPLDYRLNAKAIVGKLPGDLERLQDPSAKDLKKFGEQAFKFISGGSPVSVMLNILGGALKNIPGGYLAQAADVADDWAARGFSRGVVIGAARKPQSYMMQAFGRVRIPSWGKIGAANYVGGLLAGYIQGRALSHNQYVIFWKDLKRRMGSQKHRGPSSAWGEKQWHEWYEAVAVALRRFHL